MKLSHAAKSRIFDGNKMSISLLRAEPDDVLATAGMTMNFRAGFDDVQALLDSLELPYKAGETWDSEATLHYRNTLGLVNYKLPEQIEAKTLVALLESNMLELFNCWEGQGLER